MQRVQRGSTERLFFEFRNAADALTDPLTPKVTIEDKDEVPLIDRDVVTLTDVALTKASLGIFYWDFKPRSDAALGIVYCWPYGTIDGELKELDRPVDVEIIGVEMVSDQSLLVSLGVVKELLDIKNTEKDGMLYDLIRRVCAGVETFCGRKFKAARYTEYRDGNGDGIIFVSNPPIIGLTTLYDDPNRLFASTALIPTADYVIYDKEGVVQLSGSSSADSLAFGSSFAKGIRNIKYTYTGGYQTLPPDVEQAAAIWVIHSWKKTIEKTYGLHSRSMGGTDQQFAQQDMVTQQGIRRVGSMPNETRELLLPFKMEHFS